MENIELILLQASGGASSIIQMLPMIGIIIVIYFFFMRPQQKKQKEQANFITGLEKGDEVVTMAGILGRVNKIEGDIVTLQIDTKTFIRVVKSAVSKEMTEQANAGTEVEVEK